MSAPDGSALSNALYYKQRLASIEEYERRGRNAYPHKFAKTHELGELVAAYDNASLANGDVRKGAEVAIAGRLLERRSSSAKLHFYDVVGGAGDARGRVQVLVNFAKQRELALDNFRYLHEEVLRRGDVIGVRGHVARSRRGEFSVLASLGVVLLAPCYQLLPEANRLEDAETRHRRRHLDLLVNDDATRVFALRSRAIAFIRRFFAERDFVEVETPVLALQAGGASARPFRTHLNDLKLEMTMRVAPELYLKQLVIGGFERVFEIGKNFRNEGIDMSHNPEFTAIESYEAYADYHDVMRMTEQLLERLVRALFGGATTTLTYHAADGRALELDFAAPYPRVPIIATLERRLNVTFPADLSDADGTVSRFLAQLLDEHAVACDEPRTATRMLDKLVGAVIEPELVQPSFLVDHPQFMCPLAKWHRDAPGLTERFELFVVGRELCNAYTELNDPRRQRALFHVSERDAAAGDDEAQTMNDEFCDALDYALPPTGGWGMGIDRLVMLLADKATIRDVILFPTMKPRAGQSGTLAPSTAAAEEGDSAESSAPSIVEGDGSAPSTAEVASLEDSAL